MIDVIFAHNDESIPESFLPPENLSRRQLQRWKSRRMANFLLKKLFSKHQLDLNLLEQIQRTASGRPFVQNSEIDFNISHSGDWIAVIFSQDFAKKAVGIDIEHPQKERQFKALIRHYANQEEINELLEENQTDLETLADRFYLSWCLREAVLKSQGVGIVKLSEVRHLPKTHKILTAYAPQGELHFYHQLPFYLAYFFEGETQPQIYQWQAGNLQKITQIRPLVYKVNEMENKLDITYPNNAINR